MRVALVMGDQADARIVPDVFGVFGEGADKDEQAAIVIHQIGCDRAERVTIEFFRQGAQRAIAMGAQHQARFVGIFMPDSFSAVCSQATAQCHAQFLFGFGDRLIVGESGTHGLHHRACRRFVWRRVPVRNRAGRR